MGKEAKHNLKAMDPLIFFMVPPGAPGPGQARAPAQARKPRFSLGGSRSPASTTRLSPGSACGAPGSARGAPWAPPGPVWGRPGAPVGRPGAPGAPPGRPRARSGLGSSSGPKTLIFLRKIEDFYTAAIRRQRAGNAPATRPQRARNAPRRTTCPQRKTY